MQELRQAADGARKENPTMPIDLTDAAVGAVKEAMKAEAVKEGEVYLRVGVRAGGCSGFSYMLAFDNEVRAGDSMVEKDGVRLLIDQESGLLLAGTVIDYSSGPYEEGFVFNNPNQMEGGDNCGCGSGCGCGH